MAEKINIQLTKQRHPELFGYFETFEGTSIQALGALLNQNEKLKKKLDERSDLLEDFTKLLKPELLQMRLALRATEKQTWLLAQIKNTELYEREVLRPDQPLPKAKTFAEYRSEPFAILDGKWKEMLTTIRQERAERASYEMNKWEESLK
ncbi:hypothetical protein [Lactococcus allomyrinae]|uniref:Uncharacterized protein n=1 Tax=Lactococcus allomyrinae TaxID=2419773 RepID=A0A387BH99_9LACT|nr:hypothetical protein [Lactococcus allomyrinae]AYG02028.1 hypothetical protein D7I46_12890 [Lactococcus allomyrinae]